MILSSSPGQTRDTPTMMTCLSLRSVGGVTGLCEHNLPYTHTLDDLSTGPSVHLSAVKSPMSYPERRCERVRKTETIEYDDTKLERQTDECIESIGAWRLFAERAVLLLELAASLRSRTDPPDKEKTRRVTRRVLVRRLNKWLDMANVGVVCGDTATGEWPSGLQVRIATRGGLFGVIAVQLLLATTLTELLFTCAACGTIFNAAPAERPRERGKSVLFGPELRPPGFTRGENPAKA